MNSNFILYNYINVDFLLICFFIEKLRSKSPPESILSLKKYDQFIKTDTIYKIKNVKKLLKIIKKFYEKNGDKPLYYYKPYGTLNNPKLAKKIKSLFWKTNGSTFNSVYDFYLHKLNYNQNIYLTNNVLCSFLNIFGYKFNILIPKILSDLSIHSLNNELNILQTILKKSANKIPKEQKSLYIVFKKTRLLGGNKIYPIISDKDSLNTFLTIKSKIIKYIVIFSLNLFILYLKSEDSNTEYSNPYY